jgi:1-deoxy-D-xylulose-5-phosphate synthase
MLKGMTVGGTLFEELGFSYIGPIDGHDMDQLLPVLRTVRAGDRADPDPRAHRRRARATPRPRPPRDGAMRTAKFDVVTGKQKKAPSNAPSYTKVFAKR